MSNGMGLTMRRGLADGLHPDASFSRVDTFTGWIEVFPTQTEKAEEVIKNKKQKTKNKQTKNKKNLLHEIIPRFGLPRSLQSDNGTSFTSKVTQGVSEALGITYYLHYA